VASFGIVGSIVAAVLVTVLQAVDGVSLKHMAASRPTGGGVIDDGPKLRERRR
jgi:hypothetical protein